MLYASLYLMGATMCVNPDVYIKHNYICLFCKPSKRERPPVIHVEGEMPTILEEYVVILQK